MYLPPQFKAKTREHAFALIRSHPFASLISNDDDGLPFVTPLPLHLLEEGGETLLLGHCAKPNPHWKYLAARPKSVVTFMGPHAYMTPRVYPDLARVPTWNYVMVQARGTATVHEDAPWLRAQVDRLTGAQESGSAHPWQVGDAPADFVTAQMRAIVGIEIAVTDLRGKFKVSQNRPAQDKASVLAALDAGQAGTDYIMAQMLRHAMSGD